MAFFSFGRKSCLQNFLLFSLFSNIYIFNSIGSLIFYFSFFLTLRTLIRFSVATSILVVVYEEFVVVFLVVCCCLELMLLKTINQKKLMKAIKVTR
jgi:hypothetical protein